MEMIDCKICNTPNQIDSIGEHMLWHESILEIRSNTIVIYYRNDREKLIANDLRNLFRQDKFDVSKFYQEPSSPHTFPHFIVKVKSSELDKIKSICKSSAGTCPVAIFENDIDNNVDISKEVIFINSPIVLS